MPGAVHVYVQLPVEKLLEATSGPEQSVVPELFKTVTVPPGSGAPKTGADTRKLIVVDSLTIDGSGEIEVISVRVGPVTVCGGVRFTEVLPM